VDDELQYKTGRADTVGGGVASFMP